MPWVLKRVCLDDIDPYPLSIGQTVKSGIQCGVRYATQTAAYKDVRRSLFRWNF
jgi:hypothetical protein